MFRKDSFLDRLSTVVARGGQERFLGATNQSVYSGFGVPPTFRQEAALDAYDDNVWLFSAVTKVANELARTKFKLRTRGDDPQQIVSHQALDALNLPQPIKSGKSMLTAFDLKYVSALHLLLPGEAFWVLQDRLNPRVGGSPTRIDVVLPYLMRPRLDDRGDLADYVFQGAKGEQVIRPEDVVHFKLPDGKNLYRGHSPAQSIRYAVDSHEEADILNLKLLQNGGLPQGFLKSEANMTPEQMRTLREQWQQMYGGGRNGGKVAVLPNKMDFQEVQRTQQEMQYAEGKRTNRDEILAAYGVGLEILGRTESQTRANAEAAIYVFMKFGVTPFLDKFVDTLNNDYLVAFAGTEDLEFYYDDRVPENLEDKRATAAALFQMGGLTPDEARAMFGLEALGLRGVSDVPYLPFSAIAAGTEKLPPDAPPLGEDQNQKPAGK